VQTIRPVPFQGYRVSAGFGRCRFLYQPKNPRASSSKNPAILVRGKSRFLYKDRGGIEIPTAVVPPTVATAFGRPLEDLVAPPSTLFLPRLESPREVVGVVGQAEIRLVEPGA